MEVLYHEHKVKPTPTIPQNTKGAQQPGMTGQVKEDILCRFGELGVFVKEGKVGFNPKLLRRYEFVGLYEFCEFFG